MLDIRILNQLEMALVERCTWREARPGRVSTVCDRMGNETFLRVSGGGRLSPSSLKTLQVASACLLRIYLCLRTSARLKNWFVNE